MFFFLSKIINSSLVLFVVTSLIIEEKKKIQLISVKYIRTHGDTGVTASLHTEKFLLKFQNWLSHSFPHSKNGSELLWVKL